MLKILLVIDNYNESTFIQSTLKSLGFDVFDAQKESKVEEALLSFKADLMICTGISRSVNGVRIAIHQHRKKMAPKVVLIFAEGQTPKMEGAMAEVVAALLKSPVNPHDLIATVAQTGGIDARALFEKQQRLHEARLKSHEGSENQDLSIVSQGEDHGAKSEEPAALNVEIEYFSKEDREESYAAAVMEMPPPKVHGIPRERMIEAREQARKSCKSEEMEELERERQAFAQALFSKS